MRRNHLFLHNAHLILSRRYGGPLIKIIAYCLHDWLQAYVIKISENILNNNSSFQLDISLYQVVLIMFLCTISDEPKESKIGNGISVNSHSFTPLRIKSPLYKGQYSSCTQFIHDSIIYTVPNCFSGCQQKLSSVKILLPNWDG